MKRFTLLLALLAFAGCDDACRGTTQRVVSVIGDCTLYRVREGCDRPIFTTICSDGRTHTHTTHSELEGKVNVDYDDAVDTAREGRRAATKRGGK